MIWCFQLKASSPANAAQSKRQWTRRRRRGCHCVCNQCQPGSTPRNTILYKQIISFRPQVVDTAYAVGVPPPRLAFAGQAGLCRPSFTAWAVVLAALAKRIRPTLQRVALYAVVEDFGVFERGTCDCGVRNCPGTSQVTCAHTQSPSSKSMRFVGVPSLRDAQHLQRICRDDCVLPIRQQNGPLRTFKRNLVVLYNFARNNAF